MTMAEVCARCRKRLYATLRGASRAAIGSSASFGVGFRVYRCPAGAGFHLTSRRKAA